MSPRRTGSLAALALALGCSAGTDHSGVGPGGDASLADARELTDGAGFDVPATDDSSSTLDGSRDSGAASCIDGSLDMKGCTCSTAGATRACFSGDASNHKIGACKDGTQTCVADGELKTWGPCAGDVLPSKENCTDHLDHDCNGLLDCKDPSCATNPACKTGCTDGAVRDCYTGPAGTLGVGTCKAGKQKCVGTTWETACAGEVLPTAEVCSDPLDHNCNHAPGCLDFFFCIADPACGDKCKAPLDPGCVCADGSGDTATCPKGTHIVSSGDLTKHEIECCPCTPSDCGDANCCGEALCKGSSKCGGVTCRDLPASCGGKVSADCDDFPEDCDEPCCECYGDCSSAP